MRLSRLFVSGYSRERSRPGLIAPDFPGIMVLAITDWQSVGRYGGEVMAASGLLHRERLSRLFLAERSGYDLQIS